MQNSKQIDFARDHIEELLDQGIGVTEGLSRDNMATLFANPPMPLLCLSSCSEMLTPEEILFFRAYQELAVGGFGSESETVHRVRGIPMIKGANTEILTKGSWQEDSCWRFLRSTWTTGWAGKECQTIQQVADAADQRHWQTHKDQLATLWPAVLMLAEEFKINFEVVQKPQASLRVHIVEIGALLWVNNECDEIHLGTGTVQIYPTHYDTHDPNCYDKILETCLTPF